MSQSKTLSRTVLFSPVTSCATWRIWQLFGIPLTFSAPEHKCLSSVVFPVPLRPTSPYLLPLAKVRLESFTSSFPAISTEMLSRLRSTIGFPPWFLTMVGTFPLSASFIISLSASLCCSSSFSASSFCLCFLRCSLAFSLSDMSGRVGTRYWAISCSELRSVRLRASPSPSFATTSDIMKGPERKGASPPTPIPPIPPKPPKPLSLVVVVFILAVLAPSAPSWVALVLCVARVVVVVVGFILTLFASSWHSLVMFCSGSASSSMGSSTSTSSSLFSSISKSWSVSIPAR
mmetsp:Transcript_9549/g.17922  ORF Transcript_9549/g.17922 Transcript_9549/m.17922 type:complete len:289 (-) Transcript_9549:171-1037(-)